MMVLRGAPIQLTVLLALAATSLGTNAFSEERLAVRLSRLIGPCVLGERC
jgi:hypothetical protein